VESFVEVSVDRYLLLCADSRIFDELSVAHSSDRLPVVVVDFNASPTQDRHGFTRAAEALATLPCVVIGVHDDDPAGVADVCDMVLTAAEFSLYEPELRSSIGANPLAAVALALLLRGSESRTIAQGLVAESTVYSLLQSGPEFTQWLGARAAALPENPDVRTGPAVLADRAGDTLHLTLNRPRRHNAFSRAVRDALAEGLGMVDDDPSIRAITLDGAGPSFCSGGDLTEFGTFPTPVMSHFTRLTRSPARLLSNHRDMATVKIHGACYGAGIELPAFAGHVVADPASRIRLPEIGLGLIPGAGGTVSLPRRIGRSRTALLALSQTVLSAGTALDWGLVDEIAERRGT
jgi:enoyl-CoA hydratase/carnithine racemase